MRVLVDVSAVPEQPVGAGVYIINLVGALDARAEVELELLARAGDRGRWRQVAPHSRVHARVPEARPLRLAWEQALAPRLARSLGVEVWHGPHYTLPLRYEGPKVVTIHDMTFFEHPEFHERAKVTFFQRMIREAARRASVLVAVSDDTARRVERILAPSVPVVVAPHGVDRSRYRPAADEATVEADMAALEAVGVRPPFLAFVGTLEPRKNIPGLVAAFSRVSRKHKDLHLVIAGREGWGAREVNAAIARSGLADRIHLLGYAEADLLPVLYRRAAAVVYPSHAEGFGLPALEALACGAPLVTSTGTPMAEVAGDAAVLVSPGDDTALADAVEWVLTDEGLAAGLREAGPRVAGRYSWGVCARAHIEAYQLAIGGPG
ncbi:MAG: glycosyltransferase family 4 protein [Actinobacteria bacterium]|nr:glycosyltransferase family 4 protein [Actinomycetota bacterium]